MNTILFLLAAAKPSVTRKLAGVYDAARRQNWNVQNIEGLLTPSKVRKLIDFWQPDDIIVECGAASNQFDPALFGRIPVVFLDRNPKTLATPAFCVMHNSAATARLAARELLTLSLSAYGYVPWPEPRFWSEDREREFAASLRLNGKGYSRITFKGRRPGDLDLQTQLVDWLRTLPRPLGIFAANDEMASHVLAAAGRLGLSIPQDIAVIGVDNNEMLCENTHPCLSSIMPDFEAAGRMAAEMLLARMTKPRLSPRTKLFGPHELVRRTSTARMKKHDAEVLAARDLIRRRACEGLKAADVVKLFPCSRRMAEIRFRAVTGHSILDEIQDVRRVRALELLKDPTLDRNAVANFCGYSSGNALMNFLRTTSCCQNSTVAVQRKWSVG